MFQTIKAKSAGLGHVWAYVTEYHSVPVDEALRRIEMHRPYPNANCIQCHSTRLPGWLEVQDHRGMLGDLRSGRVSCASRGCHGPAHPFGRGAEAP
jgi:cytochrome c-type protein NapC